MCWREINRALTVWWPSLGLLLWEFCNAQWLGLHYKTGGGRESKSACGEREKTQDALQPAHTKWTVIESSAELWMCHLLRLYSSYTSASFMKCHLSCQTPTLWSSISSNYTHTHALSSQLFLHASPHRCSSTHVLLWAAMIRDGGITMYTGIKLEQPQKFLF